MEKDTFQPDFFIPGSRPKKTENPWPPTMPMACDTPITKRAPPGAQWSSIWMSWVCHGYIMGLYGIYSQQYDDNNSNNNMGLSIRYPKNSCPHVHENVPHQMSLIQGIPVYPVYPIFRQNHICEFEIISFGTFQIIAPTLHNKSLQSLQIWIIIGSMNGQMLDKNPTYDWAFCISNFGWRGGVLLDVGVLWGYWLRTQ